jgi:hypothetical protein
VSPGCFATSGNCYFDFNIERMTKFLINKSDKNTVSGKIKSCRQRVAPETYSDKCAGGAPAHV